MRCLKALNAFKVFSSYKWGGDTDILLQLYNSFIRSKLDYACHIYGSARPTYINMLKPTQNQGLRLAPGAFRTSPKPSLYAKANELSLDLRRKKLGLQYAIKLSANPSNSAYSCVFDIPNDIINITKNKEFIIKPFGLRILEDIKDLHF